MQRKNNIENIKNNPIGIFDSGVGGLSVLTELLKVLPNEKFLYYGDTANVPYGDKSIPELLQYTRNILDFFKTKNVKTVVVACNTCCANTLDIVKTEYDFEIIGLIEPTAEYIKTLMLKNTGLIATTATVNSNAYPKKIEPFGTKVYQQSCPELVKFVESGNVRSKEVENVLFEYLKPLLNQNIEKLILGCTHYPFLITAMKNLGLNDDFFINPAVCASNQTKQYLLTNKISGNFKKAECEFFVSGETEDFIKNAKLFFGQITTITQVK